MRLVLKKNKHRTCTRANFSNVDDSVVRVPLLLLWVSWVRHGSLGKEKGERDEGKREMELERRTSASECQIYVT